ncbi:MAG: DUF262 domain-containing HNH endonuclease family protein [Muribaculum sp.]|nr:DUF262 domain-containing HNH endonuclease family protein [Muribaculum sp.]
MPTKNIEPQLRLISEYTFLKKDDVFEIPQYQRAYSWNIMQCSKLWQDIESFIESGAEDPYFFGTIIVDCSSDNRLSLIDGQQRTTTFLLLLKALQLQLKEAIGKLVYGADTRALARGLESSYATILKILYKAEEDEAQIQIEQNWDNARNIPILQNNSINELHRDDFQTIMEAETFWEAEKKVYKIPRKQKDNKYTNFFRNFKYFWTELGRYSESQLNNFAKVFLSKCQIIEIRSWQIEQAITMFNSLNSTGMPLSDADIISAQLYSSAGEENRVEFMAAWTKIKELANELGQRKIIDIDGVLQEFMYINRSVQRHYKINEVTTPGLRKYYLTEHSEILKHPLPLCASYKKILDIWNKIIEYPIVKLLMKFNENFKLFLISYLNRFNVEDIDKSTVEPIAECMLRLFALVESGDTPFSSSNFKTFLFNENFNLVDPSYPLASIIEDFDRHISSTWKPENVSNDLHTYEKNILVYLNEYLYSKEQNRYFDIDERTNVEHVMPASGHNIEVIRQDAGIDDEAEFAALVNQLGNKILLEETINKSISNDWFKTKKASTIESRNGYVNSRFGFALDLAKWPKERWEKDDITAATEAAARRITKFIFNK